MPPSILRLPSSVANSSGAKRNLGPEPLSGAEPEVRIHLPPAESRANFRFLSGFPNASTVGNARLPRRGSGGRSNIVAYSRPRASRFPGGSGSAYPSLAVKGDAPDVMSIRGRAIVKPSLSGLLDILNHLQAYHAHARRALVRMRAWRSCKPYTSPPPISRP